MEGNAILTLRTPTWLPTNAPLAAGAVGQDTPTHPFPSTSLSFDAPCRTAGAGSIHRGCPLLANLGSPSEFDHDPSQDLFRLSLSGA